ncbi:MAG: hypothetical protein AAF870_07465, partial [Pseudomonadota bacterium]
MKIQPINSIECALLHNRYSPMADSKLESLVKSQARAVGCSGEVHHSSTRAGVLVFNVGEYQVSVSQIDEALPKNGFGGCLPQPITILMMPDAEHRVDRHRAHTFVSISRQVPTSDDRLDISSASVDPLDFFLSEDAQRAMKLCYLLADALHRNNPASAIHWLPSDHLVSPQMFENAALGPSLTPFFVRPYLYSSAGAIGDGNPVGMVANGSQYLLGKPVIFEEAAVEYPWMIQRVWQFIDKALRADVVPAHGSGFSVEDGEIIEVIHKDPEPVNPMGSFTLIARNVPKFGITGALQSVLRAPVDVEPSGDKDASQLDENDPIDLAILNALRARAEA